MQKAYRETRVIAIFAIKNAEQEEEEYFASNRFINKILWISIEIPVHAYNPDKLSFQRELY